MATSFTTTLCAFRPTAASHDRRSEPASPTPVAPVLRRRAALGAAAAAALGPLLQAGVPRTAAAAEEQAGSSAASSSASAPAAVVLVKDEPGNGTAEARRGDLVLLHYEGRTADGTLFDSTLGGQLYRDGGIGKLRPALIALGGSPVPGICAGLQQGIEGMRVGGRRTFNVPPSLGFGNAAVLAPYGIVPGGSEVQYEVRLLRLSRQGPEALMSGVSQCGAGAVMERTAGCADITIAEFL